MSRHLSNGNPDTANLDEQNWPRHLLPGARNADTIIPALARAADALLDLGRAFENVSLTLSKIGTNTARAISDNIQIKQYLKGYMERELVLRRELDALKARMPVRRGVRSKKKQKTK